MTMQPAKSIASEAFRLPRATGRRRPVERLLAILQLWMERHRQRQRLAELDEDRLQDIGVSRADALREAAKPFWR